MAIPPIGIGDEKRYIGEIAINVKIVGPKVEREGMLNFTHTIKFQKVGVEVTIWRI